MEKYRILTINPGSTSTKIGIFDNIKPVFIKSLNHKMDDIRSFACVADQYEFRRAAVLQELKNAEIELSGIHAIVARGGLVKPIASGVYEVNERMKEDLRVGVMGQHASNLGGLIAADLALRIPNVKAYIADPVVVDELQDVARLSGHPKFKRLSIFHALNQKAIARQYAHANNHQYDDLNLIIAHLGGGISVGAHCKGKVIDVNNALDGEGPFSPERSGTLPTGQLMRMCFSQEYSEEEVNKMLVGEGGLMAYLNTNQEYEVEKRSKRGDVECKLVLDAMAYQVGKAIGEMSTVLKGRVHAILLTGGIANSRDFCEYIRSMVSFIAPVIIYPGEDELAALAHNGLMVLRGTAEAKVYT